MAIQSKSEQFLEAQQQQGELVPERLIVLRNALGIGPVYVFDMAWEDPCGAFRWRQGRGDSDD